MEQWTVEVVEFATDAVVKSVPCGSRRSAEKVDRGMNINLNHEKFYTRIVSEAERAPSAGSSDKP